MSELEMTRIDDGDEDGMARRWVHSQVPVSVQVSIDTSVEANPRPGWNEPALVGQVRRLVLNLQGAELADQPCNAAFAYDENLDPLKPDDPTGESAITIACAFMESGGTGSQPEVILGDALLPED
ncbi:hypothetical protein [Nonomuraea sp. NPDC049646]|uniref:hypothetical protein n=1 Tax=unclassified Nonomuraea TaxID=2593643 RepID=UPI003791FF28